MPSSAKSSRASRLAKKRQEVAAVCYRVGKRGIEFLLVQTTGGRWIFPKGGVEPGLTHAQSAALEAFEEAGVHGRMEKLAFSRYFRPKPETSSAKNAKRSAARSSHPELAITTHLCEVSRLEPPQELNRNPTWFPPEKTKQRLCEGRATEFGTELTRVVDHAVKRIDRQHSKFNHSDRRERDALQKVRFEALDDPHLRADLMERALARHFLGLRRDGRSVPTISGIAQKQIRKYLQSGSPLSIGRPVFTLRAAGTSSIETAHNVTAIDQGRNVNSSKVAGSNSRSREGRTPK
jgi:8-oxo-dGTP pyrophosphatase MutT (NUDIX family)